MKFGGRQCQVFPKRANILAGASGSLGRQASKPVCTPLIPIDVEQETQEESWNNCITQQSLCSMIKGFALSICSVSRYKAMVLFHMWIWSFLYDGDPESVACITFNRHQAHTSNDYIDSDNRDNQRFAAGF
jgi:hypothetical protein